MSLKQRLLAFIVALLGIVIAALSTLAYKEMRGEIVTGVTHEIESAVRGNREAIARWMNHRRDTITATTARLRSCSRSFEDECQESQVDELRAGVELSLAVFPEAAAFLKPGKGAFDDPSLGHDGEGV